MTLDEVRERFERWYSDGGTWPAALERSGSGYRLMQAQAAWVVWLAAFKDAAESVGERKGRESF